MSERLSFVGVKDLSNHIKCTGLGSFTSPGERRYFDVGGSILTTEISLFCIYRDHLCRKLV